MANVSNFARGYNSFSGVDIKVVFANKVVAELQAISYSVTREKAPLYTMGSADPRSYSRGKRGIAGTLIFLVFDRHALIGTFGMFAPEDDRLKFLSDIDDVRPEASDTANIQGVGIATGPGSIVDVNNLLGVQASETSITSVAADQQVVAPWFTDQIPPFDITLAAANEYGSLAVMRIYVCEILNEGYGVSIDDIVSEQQMTYVARTLVGWKPVRDPKVSSDLAAAGLKAGITG